MEAPLRKEVTLLLVVHLLFVKAPEPFTRGESELASRQLPPGAAGAWPLGAHCQVARTGLATLCLIEGNGDLDPHLGKTLSFL